MVPSQSTSEMMLNARAHCTHGSSMRGMGMEAGHREVDREKYIP